MSVRLLLCFAVLAAVEADTAGGIGFWLKDVTMICPEEGTWYKEDKTIDGIEITGSYRFEYDNENKGLYHCQYERINYYFYVQGKVCDNCFELDGTVWAAIIVGDMVLTVVVMVIVYKCTKKRSSGGRPHTPKAGAPPGGRAPPVPSPDYEQLNLQTTSQGTYAGIHTNSTG